jgi:hypothetical protein
VHSCNTIFRAPDHRLLPWPNLWQPSDVLAPTFSLPPCSKNTFARSSDRPASQLEDTRDQCDTYDSSVISSPTSVASATFGSGFAAILKVSRARY